MSSSRTGYEDSGDRGTIPIGGLVDQYDALGADF